MRREFDFSSRLQRIAAVPQLFSHKAGPILRERITRDETLCQGQITTNIFMFFSWCVSSPLKSVRYICVFKTVHHLTLVAVTHFLEDKDFYYSTFLFWIMKHRKASVIHFSTCSPHCLWLNAEVWAFWSWGKRFCCRNREYHVTGDILETEKIQPGPSELENNYRFWTIDPQQVSWWLGVVKGRHTMNHIEKIF